MRRHGQRPISRMRMLWTVVLLGLPQVAVAESALGAGSAPLFPNGNAADERAAASPADPPSDLDLRIDPRQLPSAQELPDGALGIEGDWPDGAAEPDAGIGIEKDPADDAAGRRAADRGLSFGLEVQPRSRMGALARQHEARDDPSLGAQLERLIEQPVLGVRGRYRF